MRRQGSEGVRDESEIIKLGSLKRERGREIALVCRGKCTVELVGVMK